MASNSDSATVGSRRFGNNRLISLAKRERLASMKVSALMKINAKLTAIIDSAETRFSDKKLAEIRLVENKKKLLKINAKHTSLQGRLSDAVSNDINLINGSKG